MAWPSDGLELWVEVRRHPSRLILIVDDRGTAAALAGLVGSEPLRVGQVLATLPKSPTLPDIDLALAGAPMLTEIEALLDPSLGLDAVRFLRDHSRRSGGSVGVWPGPVLGRRATYSQEGRYDRYASDLDDTMVLRSRDVDFPDETPYTVERIP